MQNNETTCTNLYCSGTKTLHTACAVETCHWCGKTAEPSTTSNSLTYVWVKYDLRDTGKLSWTTPPLKRTALKNLLGDSHSAGSVQQSNRPRDRHAQEGDSSPTHQLSTEVVERSLTFISCLHLWQNHLTVPAISRRCCEVLEVSTSACENVPVKMFQLGFVVWLTQVFCSLVMAFQSQKVQKSVPHINEKID